MGMGLRVAVLRAAGAPLLNEYVLESANAILEMKTLNFYILKMPFLQLSKWDFPR